MDDKDEWNGFQDFKNEIQEELVDYFDELCYEKGVPIMRNRNHRDFSDTLERICSELWNLRS